MSRPRYDAIFFDLDGTLVDSRVAVIDAVSAGIHEALTAAGETVPPIDAQMLRAPLGKPAPEYFRAVLPETLGHLAGAVKEAATRHEVAALAAGKGQLFDGVLEALDRLREAGVLLGVISNAQAPYFRAALRYTGLGERFQHSECHEELPPDAASPFKTTLLRRALLQLGSAPERLMMVGDRAEDIQAGISTGCATLGIPFGFGDEKELAIADRQLDSWGLLPAMVGV
ncbi:hypothetical protein DRQ32_09290 [bacterium]|nr:MAG: hypothetical protein DRQ32_09290 [bacterium]